MDDHIFEVMMTRRRKKVVIGVRFREIRDHAIVVIGVVAVPDSSEVGGGWRFNFSKEKLCMSGWCVLNGIST